MARESETSREGGQNSRDIADAASLFGDDPPSRRSPRPPKSRPVAPVDEDEDAGGAYELEDVPEIEEAPRARMEIGSDPARKDSSATAPKRAAAGRPERPEGPSDEVVEVWSRNAEWLPTLIPALISFVFYFVAATQTIRDEYKDYLEIWLLFVITYPIIILIQCYPLLITLERPVRVTPERGVTDYFDAFSHWFPSYRRMWLLLAETGRTGSDYRDYSSFKKHWKRRLSAWRRAAGKHVFWNPFEIEIVDFHSEKSVGKSRVDVRYEARISVKAGAKRKLIDSHKCTGVMVKGPDNMWYMTAGALPLGRV